MMERRATLEAAFRERFEGEPIVVRAPGRVNLIGEHTDYNDGYVLPMAIDRDVMLVVRPRDDRKVRLYSLDFDGEATWELSDTARDGSEPWSNYIRGVAIELQGAGIELRGMEGVVQGNVPIGSGLSSSAALEVAAATAFLATSGVTLDGVRVAQLCQRAEQQFVGVQVGIMDQYIAALGRAGHALFIDCRTLEHRAIPLKEAGFRVVVADSRASRELAGSAYNTRRGECDAAVATLQADLPHVRALRDVSTADFLRYGAALETTVGRRARHVIGENERVLRAITALEAGDLAVLGALMNESHESLRFDYEVSSRELDALVAAARQVEGCLGSRLTGAGFGGCTVSLVREEALPSFIDHVEHKYRRHTGLTAILYVSRAVDGASVI
jgi:galactokinase